VMTHGFRREGKNAGGIVGIGGESPWAFKSDQHFLPHDRWRSVVADGDQSAKESPAMDSRASEVDLRGNKFLILVPRRL